jgi:hypothetical protein
MYVSLMLALMLICFAPLKSTNKVKYKDGSEHDE